MVNRDMPARNIPVTLLKVDVQTGTLIQGARASRLVLINPLEPRPLGGLDMLGIWGRRRLRPFGTPCSCRQMEIKKG